MLPCTRKVSRSAWGGAAAAAGRGGACALRADPRNLHAARAPHARRLCTATRSAGRTLVDRVLLHTPRREGGAPRPQDARLHGRSLPRRPQGARSAWRRLQLLGGPQFAPRRFGWPRRFPCSATCRAACSASHSPRLTDLPCPALPPAPPTNSRASARAATCAPTAMACLSSGCTPAGGEQRLTVRPNSSGD